MFSASDRDSVYLQDSKFTFGCALVNSNTRGEVSGKFVAVIKRPMISGSAMRVSVCLASVLGFLAICIMGSAGGQDREVRTEGVEGGEEGSAR